MVGPRFWFREQSASMPVFRSRLWVRFFARYRNENRTIDYQFIKLHTKDLFSSRQMRFPSWFKLDLDLKMCHCRYLPTLDPAGPLEPNGPWGCQFSYFFFTHSLGRNSKGGPRMATRVCASNIPFFSSSSLRLFDLTQAPRAGIRWLAGRWFILSNYTGSNSLYFYMLSLDLIPALPGLLHHKNRGSGKFWPSCRSSWWSINYNS
jgi:hypothetical protein